jgi:hypothetical protein
MSSKQAFDTRRRMRGAVVTHFDKSLKKLVCGTMKMRILTGRMVCEEIPTRTIAESPKE